MNLYGAFHMFACIAQVLNYKIHACVSMLVVRLNDEMKSLDYFLFQVSFHKWYLFKVCFQVV